MSISEPTTQDGVRAIEARPTLEVEMTETDLQIAERLRKLLPPLTPEERQQLKANIELDGRVREPILYWHDGKRNVVIDGMHRWDIVRGTPIPFRTEQMHFANYEEAEVWILNHQLGRRNLLNPTEIRKIRGELYNRLKSTHGGDRKSEESKCQFETLIGDAAMQVAERAGVSPATVKRDGDRVETLENLTKSARNVAEQASDKDVKSLAKLSASDQNAVARAMRVGQARTIPDAIKLISVKAGKHESGGSSRTPAEEFKILRSKAAKTAEALVRAFDELNRTYKSRVHKELISTCQDMVIAARNWRRS